MERNMKHSLLTFALIAIFSSNALAWEPDTNDEMELSVAKAIVNARDKDPAIAKWFDTASAYVVFPRVGKGAVGVGGARGRGLVIQDDATIGRASLTQLSIGFSLGGQVYSEYIFFRDQTALDDFKRGNFELGAQVSAVALTAGASADANYSKGVAVFTIAEGGLMYEASGGGQKFKYRDPK